VPDWPGYLKLATAILGAIPVCILVNILIERVAYRRLRNAPASPPDYRHRRVHPAANLAMMIWTRNPCLPATAVDRPHQYRRRRDFTDAVLLLALAALSMGGLVLLVEKPHGPRHARHAENPAWAA
jgi:branched-chain amino acid transport system permease protein